MRLDLFKIFVVSVLAFALAFASAPWFAFRALRAATTAEDVAAVAQLVDFPAVRKSLTGQLVPIAPAASPEPPSIWQDPIGAFKKAIEPIAPPEPKADRYLTLKGLAALSQGYAPGKAPPPPPPASGFPGQLKQALGGLPPLFSYWDPDRARITVRRPGEPSKITVFTFERRALFTWKLSHIQLPADER
ncbi:DUF2939 domain-containing protein [Caulobacter mirabilis]|uniref:DUF2939 domain-containing protein n=1 Tax=Caulobacter mirabilis TaxID=69666 RepID=A0A2D2AVI4_9CAUL|nr:DUF2939 domain-containing protein [Caulobacter mirabilis]ATQ42013.1 hypothetical protein CSW64_06090 [Caulobacter mirabilis]